MNDQEMYKHITKKEFKLAKDYLDTKEIKEFDKLLTDVCWKHRDKVVYDFLKYLVKNESNGSKQIFYCEGLIWFLTDLVHWSSSFKEGIKIGKKVLKNNPEDLDIKKRFIDYYLHPNLNEYISSKEIVKIAKEILRKEPRNKEALRILK